MSAYTLTPAEIGRLVKARALQVARYRAAHLKEHGCLPGASDPACCTSLANVAFVNGCTVETAVSLSRLSAWARTFGPADQICVGGPKGATDGAELRLRCMASSLRLVCWPEHFYDGKQETPRPALGEPLRLIAPAAGGAFACEFDDGAGGAELVELRAQAGAVKADTARRKRWGEARRAEVAAFEALSQAKGSAETARAVVGAMTFDAAVDRARRCLAARRRARAIGPAFEAATNQYPADIMPATFDDGQDTRDAYFVHAIAYAEAVKALRAYKPPMRRAYPSAPPRPVYGPKHEKLTEAKTKALDAMRAFLRARFGELLAGQGLPAELSNHPRTAEGWTGFDPLDWQHREYSRARNLLRAWPAESGKLMNAYREAMLTRQGLEPEKKPLQ